MDEPASLPSIKRKDKNRRVIAWISDLHLLSSYGLCPPNMKSAEGNALERNIGQVELWRHWLKFVKTADELNVDTVCVIGDVIHGTNVKESGIQLMSTNLDDQITGAVKTLKMISQGRRVFIWSGSGYHISTRAHNTEKDICDHKELASVAESTHWMGPLSLISFPPSEKLMYITHGVSAAFIYREMLMGREILFIKEAEASEKIPKIDVIIRGHWHKFYHLHTEDIHFIQLPGWNLFTPWKGSLISYGKFQPDIGGVITIIDERDRMDVWHFLYPLPKVVDIPRLG